MVLATAEQGPTEAAMEAAVLVAAVNVVAEMEMARTVAVPTEAECPGTRQ